MNFTSFNTKGFFEAVGKGNLQKIKQDLEYLNEKEEELISNLMKLPDDNGDTVLHVAARFDQQETFIFLAEQGSSIDLKNKQGMTPYDLASEKLKGMIQAWKEIKELCKANEIEI
eukprot:gb/GECH01014288.1/.p1 GENE.gb/GECH01014288.1/~~gb/GECH01014288.1/.p1  ORF type:complete len:115 (+),score=33.08 gb/GECH01014288.1/:1-345(+)